jgi:hypothetical protein
MATHKQRLFKKYNIPKDSSFSVEELANFFKIPKKYLQEVYNRGVGAWESNPESVRLLSGEKNYSSSRAGKMSKEQWAMARVYSFLNKGKTYKTTDSDIADDIFKEKNKLKFKF